jgi:integrase
MGVFTRGKRLWVRYRDIDGTWCNASTEFVVGQERLAQATYDEITARVRSATAAGETVVGPLTVRKYAADWIEERRRLDLDWKNDRARLQHHVLPVIGDMKIADVRTRHIIDLSIGSGRTRSGRWRNAPSTASTRRCRRCSAMRSSPTRSSRPLAVSTSASSGRSSTKILSGGPRRSSCEVETLISHPEIPLDRRIVYALELLAGVRTGEAAALRWRHYDPTKQPLGELLVAFSYSTLRSREKTTKTDSSKHIPVHPTLAAMLAEWKLGGWAAMMGRHPEPDDLIVPMQPEHAARRRTPTGEAFRGHDYSGERWRRDDLPALGWRHRRHYDMRATFITLALEDGADQHVIETA